MTDPQERRTESDAMELVRAVQEILRHWDPIGVDPGNSAPAHEYDSYAPHIVSLAAQGCSFEELCRHLEVIRVEAIGVEANPTHDREIVSEILRAIRANRNVIPKRED